MKEYEPCFLVVTTFRSQALRIVHLVVVWRMDTGQKEGSRKRSPTSLLRTHFRGETPFAATSLPKHDGGLLKSTGVW
jgi:hypothetical protein